jgi:hypothetical protein
MNPVWPSARKLVVRVSAHPGNRVGPNAGIKQQAPGEARSESNSESVSVEICRTPRGTNNFGSPNMVMDRSTGAWHSQETAHDRLHTDSNGVVGLVVCQPDIPNSTQRSGAVGFLRVNPEEDVKLDLSTMMGKMLINKATLNILF